MSEQQQRELGLADKAMAPGTYLRFPKMGDGVYERFEKQKMGANVHYIRFEKGGLQKLDLKKIPANAWNVLSEKQVKEAIDDQLVAASRKKGNDAEIGRLLSRGANKDAVDKQGCPAVWHAADRGHCGNVRQLVLNGADVHARTRAGQTPLMCACYNGHNEVVDLLLQSGAAVNAVKAEGYESLSFLKVAESEDIDEMIADIKMKKPHARMFQKGLAELLGPGPEEA